MTHEDLKILISAYIDGEVTPSEKNIVQEHLSTCLECQKTYRNYMNISSSLSKWSNETLSPDEEIKITRKFSQRREPMFTKRTAIGLTTTLAVFIVVGSVVQMNIQRSLQGRLKSASDDIGNQFVPANSVTKMKGASRLTAGSTAMDKGSQYEPYYLASNYDVRQSSEASARLNNPVKDSAFFSVQDKEGLGLASTGGINRVRSVGGYEKMDYNQGAMAAKAVTRSVIVPQAPYQPILQHVPAANAENYDRITENGFLSVQDNPLSTFSIDVDTASYSNVRRFLQQNQLPPADAVRVEEMVNYFSYDYPRPQGNDPFSVTTHLALCPWNKNHQLLHVGLKGRSLDGISAPPSQLTFLIDVSGSMSPENRLPLLKDSFKMMVHQLRPQDKVAIVVYAGSAGMVLEPTSGDQKERILRALDNLQAGGSTAGGQGIHLAYEIAKQNFIKNGNNRVILATDGDFNVGISDTSELVRMIEERRKQGVFLTVLGFGEGNLKDGRMQELADKGNGNYYYIDNLKEGRKVLVSELGSTLFTIAKDVKIQIEFNPAFVQSYRLVGYENRMLAKEDFNNDQKDAGEIGAGHTVTALYEIVPVGVDEPSVSSVDPLKYQKQPKSVGRNSSEVLTLKLRYKEPNQDTSQLITKTLNQTDIKHEPSGDFAWASAVAEFGMLLRKSSFKGESSYNHVLRTVQANLGEDPFGLKQEFMDLVQRAQGLDQGQPGQIQFK